MAAPLTYTKDVLDDFDIHHYTWEAPVEDGGDKAKLHMQFDIQSATSAPASMVLNGVENSLEIEDRKTHAMYFCDGTEEDCLYSIVVLDSCTHETGTLHTHTVELEGGELELSLRIGQSFASTEPGAFTGATGTWQGQAFEQLDYFKLIYVPFHHHFTRSFIVLFDEPIGGACGLRLSDLDPFDLEAGTAATVNCDLKDIDGVEITSHAHRAE
jgi:hypothetical protein